MIQAATLHLVRLPNLGLLFDLFNAGKHLNHIAEPALWAELEKEQEQYQELFGRLGFTLRVDRRGFAWFHFDNASSNVSRTTRHLALLFMLLFEMKADEGMHLASSDAQIGVVGGQQATETHDQIVRLQDGWVVVRHVNNNS